MRKLHNVCSYASGSAVLVRENVGNIRFVCFPHSLLPVPHVPVPPHVVDDGDFKAERLNGYLEVLACELWFMGKVAWSSWVFFRSFTFAFAFRHRVAVDHFCELRLKLSPKLLDHWEVLRAEVHVDEPLIGYKMSPY